MRRLLAALVATVALLPAGVAAADPFDDVFADYQKDGEIDACAHSEAELSEAKRDIPNDIDQYAPEFPSRLDAAIGQRESGTCAGGSTAPSTTPAPAPGATVPGTTEPAPATTAPAQTAPAPTTTQPGTTTGAATPARDDDDGDDDAALVALIVAGGLLLLGALVWALFRFFAWEPRWLLGARHAVGEAGWRASGAWADFTDWLRSRRSPA
jgi:hypothetical protein